MNSAPQLGQHESTIYSTGSDVARGVQPGSQFVEHHATGSAMIVDPARRAKTESQFGEDSSPNSAPGIALGAKTESRVDGDGSTSYAVGIDVGGTFTDLAAIALDGRVFTTKVLTVPDDRASGVVSALSAANIPASHIVALAHGTTVVTNLLLERKGARVVLCATEGFTDLLELRRQERASLYDLTAHHPEALVPPERTVGVRERIAPEGVIVPLLSGAIDDAVSRVVALNPDIVAISFLHAYADPSHEQALRDALVLAFQERGEDCDVVCSHETLPEIREYERTATTVAEAYARPAVATYLQSLSSRLSAVGVRAPHVMSSAAGTLDVGLASKHAAALALSGPAGGVAGAAAIARALGIALALTIDIGGTSADVGVVVDGEPLVERGGSVAGVPIALPRVLVEPVAAGGGSIGWTDEGGALRAGPHSAGAVPGPAAYDSGGVEATVTDAHVVLGHIAEGEWSGGVRIVGERARSAMQMLSTRLGVSPLRAASALINTADATMARALRRVSVERGIDPRHATLVAFGGGGPLHACGLAERLSMTRVLVPPHAGVLSAVGLALAPERREGLASLMLETCALPSGAIATVFDTLVARLRGDEGQGLEPSGWVRARYAGQGYELEIAIDRYADGAVIAALFARVHEQRMGFVLDRAVECVSLRVALVGKAWPITFARAPRNFSPLDSPSASDPNAPPRLGSEAKNSNVSEVKSTPSFRVGLRPDSDPKAHPQSGSDTNAHRRADSDRGGHAGASSRNELPPDSDPNRHLQSGSDPNVPPGFAPNHNHSNALPGFASDPNEIPGFASDPNPHPQLASDPKNLNAEAELFDYDDGGPLTQTVVGPCTIRLPDATMHVAKGWTGTALSTGGWMLVRDA